MMEYSQDWEEYAKYLFRVKVDGGYLYSTNFGNTVATLAFVPDMDLSRYQSHLRDAYSKGYRDAQDDAKNGVVVSDEDLNDGRK